MKAEDVDKRMALITPTLGYDALKDADVVIEAVFETMEVKKDRVRQARRRRQAGRDPGDQHLLSQRQRDRAADQRAADVIGMHFFSPANVMKLLEIVRGKDTRRT